MEKHHINQLRQLVRRRSTTVQIIAAQILAGKTDAAAKSIVAGMQLLNTRLTHTTAAPQVPARSDICKNCRQGWRRCGCPSLEKMVELPDNASDETVASALGYDDPIGPVYKAPNIGESIIKMLGQTPVEMQPVTITEAEKEAGLRWAFGNQQPKPRRGTIPVEWV